MIRSDSLRNVATDTRKATADPRSRMALAQGAYFLVTGIWPLVSIETFELVTGPKRDRWLVKTVGVIIAVIGGVLVGAGLRRQADREIPYLAIGSAAGLGAIDVLYSLRGTISKIYLADAVAEAGLIAGWVLALAGRARR